MYGVKTVVLFMLLVSGLAITPTAQAACLTQSTDITGDLKTNVVDVQCVILTILASLGGQGFEPICLIGDPDTTCDGTVDVVDVQVVAQSALGQMLSPDLDCDADGCPDTCEPDVVCEKDVICELSGAAGTVATCQIMVARSAVTDEFPVGIQFFLNFEKTLKFNGFEDEWCLPGIPCFTAPVPLFPLSTGHLVVLQPKSAADWDTSGQFLAVAWGPHPEAAVSEAYIDANGIVVGDPVIVTAQFTFLQDTGDAHPARVGVIKPITTSADANPLMTITKDGLIVVGCLPPTDPDFTNVFTLICNPPVDTFCVNGLCQ